MKTLNLKNSKLKTLILVALMSSCAESKFGKGLQVNTSPSDALSSDNTAVSSAVINMDADSSDSGGDALTIRSLALTSSSSADFLESVVSADYLVQGTTLKVRLKDCEDNKVSIPSSWLSGAKFKVVGNLILVKLSNSSKVQNFVIDKNSSKVFVTNNSDIAELDVASAVAGTAKKSGATVSIVKVKGRLNGASSLINLALLKDSNGLGAYRY